MNAEKREEWWELWVFVERRIIQHQIINILTQDQRVYQQINSMMRFSKNNINQYIPEQQDSTLFDVFFTLNKVFTSKHFYVSWMFYLSMSTKYRRVCVSGVCQYLQVVDLLPQQPLLLLLGGQCHLQLWSKAVSYWTESSRPAYRCLLSYNLLYARLWPA